MVHKIKIWIGFKSTLFKASTTIFIIPCLRAKANTLYSRPTKSKTLNNTFLRNYSNNLPSVVMVYIWNIFKLFLALLLVFWKYPLLNKIQYLTALSTTDHLVKSMFCNIGLFSFVVYIILMQKPWESQNKV